MACAACWALPVAGAFVSELNYTFVREDGGGLFVLTHPKPAILFYMHGDWACPAQWRQQLSVHCPGQGAAWLFGGEKARGMLK
jgi:hypothetical protein